ncbi:MAG: triose-phosphate isomerase [Calditrichaeota bacterium]|nr:triose-phosphate isomerase [Candidatus Cloacimonadota bacterium]MCB1046388.1 triose-phosphate isomerase [Calditrichota bacterium]
MRRPLIAGNWKMHMPNAEAVTLARQLRARLRGLSHCEVLVCPPFTALTAVAEILTDTEIALGAQNLHDRRSGAFTGEISGDMIRSTGASWVLIGHSERRQFFGDTDEWVARKLLAALESGLNPIVCVGESLEERDAGKLESVIQRQVHQALETLSDDLLARVTLAYEPVWAIGTGRVASPEQAQEVHALIRGLLSRVGNSRVADSVRILYGGSVKADNAASLLSQPDIDGALVGGASLEVESFKGIVDALQPSSTSSFQ